MTPKIAFHGGQCCGIKTIHGLGYSTKTLAEALGYDDERDNRDQNADQYGGHVSSKFNFFNGDAPSEPYPERIKRYVSYLDMVRPNGIIEIVLADSPDEELDQMEIWGPTVRELGFVEVANCYNSNSGNRIYIFHRKTDQN